MFHIEICQLSRSHTNVNDADPETQLPVFAGEATQLDSNYPTKQTHEHKRAGIHASEGEGGRGGGRALHLTARDPPHKKKAVSRRTLQHTNRISSPDSTATNGRERAPSPPPARTPLSRSHPASPCSHTPMITAQKDRRTLVRSDTLLHASLFFPHLISAAFISSSILALSSLSRALFSRRVLYDSFTEKNMGPSSANHSASTA